MLLTITTTHKPATDLGYLLHKSPFRCQTTELSFGTVNIFYPEATTERCTVAMLMDIDTIGMVRKRGTFAAPGMDQYVNDRPYVASSFISVAIAHVFNSALNGQCSERPELVGMEMPLTVSLPVLPCAGGEAFLRKLFEPLGYYIESSRYSLDPEFPDWGDSRYFSLELRKITTIKELLAHLYVLIPVLDNKKHYYIDAAEIDKLLARGKGWLESHPEKEEIARRYLKYKVSYAREALARLSEDEPIVSDPLEQPAIPSEEPEEDEPSLNEERLSRVLAEIKSSGAKTVLDLGCGEGKLLKNLLRDRHLQRITGMDVSIRALEAAKDNLRLEEMSSIQRERIQLLHGSLMYRDSRLADYDAATLVEVIEHLDAPRLSALQRVVFEFAKPKTVIITTPNREYNSMWKALGEKLRHPDHRFEWTRAEFQEWASSIALKYDYGVRFGEIGPSVVEKGSPTQLAVFSRALS
jgi:3' terminal RNA ribose 2'-O-methyltransferase Hen1